MVSFCRPFPHSEEKAHTGCSRGNKDGDDARNPPDHELILVKAAVIWLLNAKSPVEHSCSLSNLDERVIGRTALMRAGPG